MQIPVLIEPINNSGFRARSGEPLVLHAEGSTPDEALRNLQDLLSARMIGRHIFTIDVPVENTWQPGAGMFKDDPLFDDWQQAIADRRRELDADPDVP